MIYSVLQRSTWLVTAVLFLAAGSQAAPAPAFTSKVAAGSKSAKAGQPANIAVSLTNTGPAVAKGNVDLEVYDAQNKKVAQQAWADQALTTGKHSAYHWAWKPAKAGVYTVKLGVFSTDWKTLRYWVDKALVLKVS